MHSLEDRKHLVFVTSWITDGMPGKLKEQASCHTCPKILTHAPCVNPEPWISSQETANQQQSRTSPKLPPEPHPNSPNPHNPDGVVSKCAKCLHSFATFIQILLCQHTTLFLKSYFQRSVQLRELTN
jgi:hypothetical protein